MKKNMKDAIAFGVTIMAIACAAVIPSIQDEYSKNKVQQVAEERQKELWYTSYRSAGDLTWCPGNNFIMLEEIKEENPVLYINCHGWAVPTPQIHD